MTGSTGPPSSPDTVCCVLASHVPHRLDMLISLHSTPHYNAGNIMELTLSMRSLRPRKLESEAFNWGQGFHGHSLCSLGLWASASAGKLSTCAQRSQGPELPNYPLIYRRNPGYPRRLRICRPKCLHLVPWAKLYRNFGQETMLLPVLSWCFSNCLKK